MTTSTETVKPASSRKKAQETLTLESADSNRDVPAAGAVSEQAPSAEAPAVAAEGPMAAEAAAVEPAPTEAQVAENNAAQARKRIEEQLEALKRREAELRRELAMADHPELEEAIRALEGRAFAVSRVEAKIAQGFSKAEERKRETLEKKLAVLREKRSELDAQIAEQEAELATLGDRARAFETERRAALEQLMSALSQHNPALDAAGLDPAVLVPDVARWLPEIRALAEALSAARA